MENKSSKAKAKKQKVVYDTAYFANHPYFLKKDEEARKSIAKHGISPELLRLQAERLKK